MDKLTINVAAFKEDTCLNYQLACQHLHQLCGQISNQYVRIKRRVAKLAMNGLALKRYM
jgi:hypothetical protein